MWRQAARAEQATAAGKLMANILVDLRKYFDRIPLDEPLPEGDAPTLPTLDSGTLSSYVQGGALVIIGACLLSDSALREG